MNIWIIIGVPLMNDTYSCTRRWKTGIRLIRTSANIKLAGSATSNETIVIPTAIGTPDNATKNVSHKKFKFSPDAI